MLTYLTLVELSWFMLIDSRYVTFLDKGRRVYKLCYCCKGDVLVTSPQIIVHHKFIVKFSRKSYWLD